MCRHYVCPENSFLITITRNLELASIEALVDRKQEMIMTCLSNIQKVYENRGFKIKTLLMDREFIPMVDQFMEPNATLANEHVSDIERQIRLVKERVRGLYYSLLIKLSPRS